MCYHVSIMLVYDYATYAEHRYMVEQLYDDFGLADRSTNDGRVSNLTSFEYKGGMI